MGSDTRGVYCCGCGSEMIARLTDGSEIYPHRPDLHRLPFWKCDGCGNFVGCHHKTSNPTKPLGCIPTPEIREARKMVHTILDPIWKRGHMSRGAVYRRLNEILGYKFHTAEIRSIGEARRVYRAVQRLSKETKCQTTGQ